MFLRVCASKSIKKAWIVIFALAGFGIVCASVRVEIVIVDVTIKGS